MGRNFSLSWLMCVILAGALVAGCTMTSGSQLSQNAPEATLPPAKVGSKIVANGKVVPHQKATLGFPVNGSVAEIGVQAGDAVQAGQMLVRLDHTQQALAVAQAQARVQIAEANLAALKVGAHPQEIAAAEATVTLAQAGIAQLEQGPKAEDVASAEATVAEAQAYLQQALDGNDAMLIIAADAEAQNALATLQAAQAAYDKVKMLADIGSRPEAIQLQQATNNYVAAQAKLAVLKKGASAAAIAVARARLQGAQAQLAGLKAQARPAEIMAANAEVQAARAKLELLKAQPLAADLAAAEAQVTLAQAEYDQAAAALAQMTLRAPFAGTNVTLNTAVGEQVAAGATIAQIGDLNVWEIETDDLTEIAVARLKPGMAATITFDALPGVELAGQITQIALVGEEKAGDVLYRVVIRPQAVDQRMRWGMSAVITVVP